MSLIHQSSILILESRITHLEMSGMSRSGYALGAG